jgi:hypothetical protein
VLANHLGDVHARLDIVQERFGKERH